MAASAPIQQWVRQQPPNKSAHIVITAPLLVRVQLRVAGVAAADGDVLLPCAGRAVGRRNAAIMDWSSGLAARRVLSQTSSSRLECAAALQHCNFVDKQNTARTVLMVFQFCIDPFSSDDKRAF